MADEPDNKPRLVSVSHPSFQRPRRRQLPALVRMFIVALFGVIVAVAASYLLRTLNL